MKKENAFKTKAQPSLFINEVPSKRLVIQMRRMRSVKRAATPNVSTTVRDDFLFSFSSRLVMAYELHVIIPATMLSDDVSYASSIRTFAVDVNPVAGVPAESGTVAPIAVEIDAIRVVPVAVHFTIEVVSSIIVVLFFFNQISASSFCHSFCWPSYIPLGHFGFDE